MNEDEKRKLLRARAVALAKPQATKEAYDKYIEIVEFQLAHEKYGLEAGFVREVYPLKELTPLPCTPVFVLGVINVRGQIISVMDIRKFFDLPETGLTDSNRVIIIHSQSMEFGILADAVLGMSSVPLNEVQPQLPTLTDIRAAYLKGVTKERTVVLDADRLLSDKSIIVNEEVEGTEL